jgi:hypothetical protein
VSRPGSPSPLLLGVPHHQGEGVSSYPLPAAPRRGRHVWQQGCPGRTLRAGRVLRRCGMSFPPRLPLPFPLPSLPPPRTAGCV